MARFRQIKNSFLGGQISRTAVGRTDLPQYQHACELLQNMIPMLSGGAYRRPGTKNECLYWASGAASAQKEGPPRLIPFVVSQTEAYALAFTPARNTGSSPARGYYVRWFRAVSGVLTNTNSSGNGGLTLPYLQTEVGNNSPQTGTQLGPNGLNNYDDDIWAVQYVQANDFMWLTHPNFKPYLATRTGLDTFLFEAFDANLSGLALAQAYPYLNQNASATTLTINTATVGSGRTLTASTNYFDPNHVGSLFAVQSGTLKASGGMGFCQVTGYTDAQHVTVKVLVAFADTSAHTTWWESAWSNYRGWPRACGIFQQRLAMAGAVPTAGVGLDANGIPTGQPHSIWFSQTGNYPKFTALGDSATAGITGVLATGRNYTTPGDFVYYPVDDSEGDGQSTGPIGIQPFRVTLADSQIDTIQWLSPDQEILVGTLDQEWIVAPQNGTFDVANSIATIQSHYGSDFIPAVRIGYELMFALSSQDEVRAYQYNFMDASFFGEPVQMFFDEYPKNEVGGYSPGRRKFRQMAWDRSRNTLWCVDTAGNLFGMTRDRKLQVTMWHTHQLGGFNAAQGVGLNVTENLSSGAYSDPAYYAPDGSVISIAVVPNIQSGINDLWMVVKRTIGGIATWQIERMIGKNTVRQSAYEATFPLGAITEPLQVDAAVGVTDGGNPAVFSYASNAFANLVGYVLSGTYYSKLWGIFAIGSNGAVAAGSPPSLVLQDPLPPDYGDLTKSHQIVVGLPYTSAVQPVRIEPGTPIGSSQGAIKRISKAYVRLFKTLMCKIGAPPGMSSKGPEVVSFQPSATQTMGQSNEIFTGDKNCFLTTQYDRDGYIYIMQDQPLPFTLVAVTSEGECYDQ